ncbi:MAG: hypothetical protein J5813_07395, partial [Candidatus Methanomethylophilaceae archaeon]|nr:hypothetical protein [Candidatus Methanomethylophilaceae archaeon]
QFSQKRTIHPAVHVFLLIITAGIYSFLNIMMSIHDTNRHIKEQDNCSKWLSFSSEKDIQTYSRMPLILSVIEIFLLILCAEYVFDLFGYGQDMFNYITSLEGPVNLLDSELIRNAAIVIINVIFLKSAFESVISVPRRSPGSRYSILDTCFKFIFSQIVSLYLMNSDSMNQVFRYSTYIPIAITCAFILWILLSKKVRIYYGWSDGKVV